MHSRAVEPREESLDTARFPGYRPGTTELWLGVTCSRFPSSGTLSFFVVVVSGQDSTEIGFPRVIERRIPAKLSFLSKPTGTCLLTELFSLSFLSSDLDL